MACRREAGSTEHLERQHEKGHGGTREKWQSCTRPRRQGEDAKCDEVEEGSQRRNK